MVTRVKKRTFKIGRVGIAILMAASTGMGWLSCGEPANRGSLEISQLQVGTEENRNQAYLGRTLPVSAELRALDTIAALEFALKKAGSNDAAIYRETISEGIGGAVRRSLLYLLEVPEETGIGDYTLTLTLTDKQGSRHSAEQAVKLSIDRAAPVVTDLEIGINTGGNDLHLAAHVSAPMKLAAIHVHIEGDHWENTRVFDGPAIQGKIESHFHEHVNVEQAPAGNYRVTVTAVDQDERKFDATGTFTKK